MKKLIEYLNNNKIISIILIGVFCSVLFIVRENMEFQQETVAYVNLTATCICLWMLYNAARKKHIRWRYLIGVLLAAFVFNRFYDEEAFLNQFHFKLIYFVAVISIICFLVIIYPYIKTIILKISLLLEKWVERREAEKEDYRIRQEEQNKKNEEKKKGKDRKREKRKREIQEIGTAEMDADVSGYTESGDLQDIGKPDGRKGSILDVVFILAFIATFVCLACIVFLGVPAQATKITERITSDNWMNLLLSLVTILILLVFVIGIMVSLAIKWMQIIKGIVRNQHKREMYFVFACGLFLLSQQIFTSYSFTTDDVANLILSGKLFTFPLVLSILIPIFIIFAENIIEFTTSNKKIKKALKKCGKQTIRISKGIVQSLLDFIELATKDFLSLVIEITKADEWDDDDIDDKDNR